LIPWMHHLSIWQTLEFTQNAIAFRKLHFHRPGLNILPKPACVSKTGNEPLLKNSYAGENFVSGP
jgi:hypothetical protein